MWNETSAESLAARIDALAWAKQDGLLPAIVQDMATRSVLMLGYMNREALQQTLATRRVTLSHVEAVDMTTSAPVRSWRAGAPERWSAWEWVSTIHRSRAPALDSTASVSAVRARSGSTTIASFDSGSTTT